MAGDDLAVAGHRHGVRRGGDVDEPADRSWINRVVDSVHPHVVVAAQPDAVGQPDRWADRWQREHGQVVGLQQVDRAALDRADRAGVGPRQPVAQLGVEVRG